MMIIKMYSELEGEHVHERVFVGPDEDHLALAGTLTFRMGEWQSFGATLLLGAERMKGRVKVICKGDERVVSEECPGCGHSFDTCECPYPDQVDAAAARSEGQKAI